VKILKLDAIYNEDCLIGMNRIPDHSIDLILCDLPYGTTVYEWDIPIPLEPLWEQYNRIIKDNAAIVLFSDEPFASDIINGNRKYFRYKWIWDKEYGSNFQNARRMPMKRHEEILVFYKKLPTYNPQWWYSTPYKAKNTERRNTYELLSGKMYGGSVRERRIMAGSVDGRRYPTSILRFPRYNTKRLHPTQKPVALLEYLIKTYTNEGDVVLDNCFGSGSTLVAAVNTNRRYIGFELERKYFDMACQRLNPVCKAA
jgi:site-specific DNA-methyltransferase (adenine-specific)